MITRVLNLATRQEWVYSLSPKEAVRNAARQADGDYNTFNYPPVDEDTDYPVTHGKHTVCCGDWAAIRGA